MTDITAKNPVGITSYNVEQWARLPIWQRLTQVLNSLTLDARDADIRGNQDALAKMLDHLARGIAYMDCCRECRTWNDAEDTWVDTSVAPYAVTLDGGWVLGKYICTQGHRWTCNYAISAPSLLA